MRERKALTSTVLVAAVVAISFPQASWAAEQAGRHHGRHRGGAVWWDRSPERAPQEGLRRLIITALPAFMALALPLPASATSHTTIPIVVVLVAAAMAGTSD